MPLSRSVLERGNPPPTRQKACGACIKAKRRCDLRQPACQRCAHRGIPCVYPRKRHREASQDQAQEGCSATTPRFTQVGAAHPLPGTEDGCTLLPAMPTLSDHELLDAWVPDLLLPPETSELLPGLGDSCPSALPWPELPGPAPLPPWEADFSTALAVLDPVSGLHPCSNICERMAVHPGTLVTPTVRDRVLHTHLRYALDELTAAPRSMVLQGGTPWSHPALYRDGMPRCMQDATACCALYLAKNTANAPLVLRTVDARAAEMAAAALSPANENEDDDPYALLAHVHAMFLYHIIQLLDGDLSARAAAEPRMPRFEAAVWLLTSKLPPPPPPPSSDAAVSSSPPKSLGRMPKANIRDFWANWVFAESARKTCLVAFFFLQTYRLLSGAAMYTCGDHRALPIDRLSWTVSAPLWEAGSARDFMRAWEEDRHFHVTCFQIEDVLTRGRPEDLDLCSKMLLTSMIGIDEGESWLAAYDGKLR